MSIPTNCKNARNILQHTMQLPYTTMWWVLQPFSKKIKFCLQICICISLQDSRIVSWSPKSSQLIFWKSSFILETVISFEIVPLGSKNIFAVFQLAKNLFLLNFHTNWILTSLFCVFKETISTVKMVFDISERTFYLQINNLNTKISIGKAKVLAISQKKC